MLSFGALAKTEAPAVDPHAGAKTFFEQYASLVKAYDPAVGDRYADQAVMRNKHTYPHGNLRALELPAMKCKSLMRASMPAAKAIGDHSTYSDVRFARERDNVRVAATRYAVGKKYSSPMSLLVARENGGPWLIIEELSESQP